MPLGYDAPEDRRGGRTVFGFLAPRPARQLDRFRERFTGRSLIVHRGFPGDWLEQLLKQPGGGGHFRLDARTLPAARPTPVEWLVQVHVLPLDLPQPLFLKVREGDVLVRHLDRGGRAVHPSEIAWFLEELATRHHARLRFGSEPGHIEVSLGISVNDNEAQSMLEHLAG
jgi:hypothetical protein